MQSRDVYLPDLRRAILRTKECVHELHVGEAKFASKSFNLLAWFRNVLKTKEERTALSPLYQTPLVLRKAVGEDVKTVHQFFKAGLTVKRIPMKAAPPPTGGRGRPVSTTGPISDRLSQSRASKTCSHMQW
jgi:hypothetical protein